MTFLIAICMTAILIGVAFLKQNWKFLERKTKTIIIAVTIAVCIGLIALTVSWISDKVSSSSSKKGFYGSDGEYHPYIPEFGDDVNDWMENNW